MIKSKALKYGDTIGVIAPAGPVSRERVKIGRSALESIGFKVKLGHSCFSSYGYLSGKDEVRARDVNEMFGDNEVQGIICLRGGYGTTRLLNLIDYENIKSNPKVFVGYSDITALHIAFNQKCGLGTFHGPMVASDMAEGIDHFSRISLVDAITKTKPLGIIENPEGELIKSLAPGIAEGELVGGNLSLICASLGTAFEISTKGKILFLEDIGEKPYKIDRMLIQLLNAGKLQELEGIVLGDWSDCRSDEGEQSLSLMEVFSDILKPLNIPIIYNIKAGHCYPKLTLPLGVLSRVDGEKCKLIIKESSLY